MPNSGKPKSDIFCNKGFPPIFVVGGEFGLI